MARKGKCPNCDEYSVYYDEDDQIKRCEECGWDEEFDDNPYSANGMDQPDAGDYDFTEDL